jgi:hypothetical protein
MNVIEHYRTLFGSVAARLSNLNGHMTRSRLFGRNPPNLSQTTQKPSTSQTLL